MAETILIVDDEQHIIDLAKLYLEQEGYKTTSATDGKTALQKILHEKPSLVVLDLMLPQMDGWEVCRRVRAESDVPIIMLTARSDDIDRIVGLELGADDYLTKPFNPRELVARVRAILRRIAPRSQPVASAETAVTLDNLAIYPERRIVMVDGHEVDLRMKEFDLVYTLAQNVGMVFTREKLLDVVWGYDFAGETRRLGCAVAYSSRMCCSWRSC